MAGTVRLRWDGQAGGFGETARTFWYDAFVPDAIAAIDPDFPLSAAEAAAAAERSIRDLATAPALGGLEALSRQLLRAESVASSRIEGLVLSHRRLARATIDPDGTDRTARAVVGNIDAMDAAVALGAGAATIEVGDLLAIHARLFEGTEMARYGGRLRDRQNWIGGSSLSPRRAEFVPPPPELVPGLMEDLCAFVARADLPAVTQAAIVHAQFETIHPFVDGNGRVGRALVHIVLRRRGTVSRFVPPVSLVLLANAAAYVEGLTLYRAGELATWSTRFAHALTDSVGLAVALGTELGALQGRWRTAAGTPRRTSATERLIELLVARPVVDIPSVADQLGVSYPQAREAVLRLEEAGVLRQIVVGRKRNRAWEAPSLLDLLDAFEFEAMTPTQTGRPRRPAPRRRGG